MNRGEIMPIHLTISEDLDREFRKTIAKNKNLNKGCIRECTEEAIKGWISKNKESGLSGHV